MNMPQAQPISTGSSKLPTAVADAVESTSSNISSVASGVTDSVSNASEYVKGSLDTFGDADLVGSTEGFLNSNTLVAKFSFIVLVLIVFMILVNLGVKLVGYFMKPKADPFLISGTMNAANEVIIYQDPKNADSVPILRSNNQNKGIEFTWSLWIFVNDTAKSPKYSNIFNKGNATYRDDGIASVNNGPGLYLDNSTNDLIITMNTVAISNPEETIVVKDIPLRI